MKVKELIAELEKFDPETEVFKYDGDGDYYKDEGEDDSELLNLNFITLLLER